MTIETDIIEVLYNDSFVEWKPSMLANNLYNLRQTIIDPTFSFIDFENDILNRHDPVLVQIYRELGCDFDDKNGSRTRIHKIPKKHLDNYDIISIDCKEVVIISTLCYKLEQFENNLKSVLENDTMTDGDKLNEINNLLLSRRM